MASRKKRSMLDDVDEVPKNEPVQIDEIMSKIRESYQEIISNAEQEAITIVKDAAQRTVAMKIEAEKVIEAMEAEHAKEAEKRVEAMNKELTDLEEKKQRRMEAMNKVLEEWEVEKKRIANTHIFKPMVTLNVGGRTFTTATATLTRFPDTMLGAMFSGRHALTPDQNGAYCIDRDGRHFHEILNFLRGTTASTPKLIERRLSPAALEELKVEADFYGLKDLMFPKDCVRITGATGPKADLINGTYEATDELSGDMHVYIKVGDGDKWLMYRADGKNWQVKETEHKGTDLRWAYCVVPDKRLPHECPAGKWEVSDWAGAPWVLQPAISVIEVNGI